MWNDELAPNEGPKKNQTAEDGGDNTLEGLQRIRRSAQPASQRPCSCTVLNRQLFRITVDQTIALFCRNQTSMTYNNSNLFCVSQRNGLSRSGSQAVTPLFPLKQPEPGYQPWSPEFSGAVFTPTSVKLLFKWGLLTPEQHKFQLWGSTYAHSFSNRYIGKLWEDR